MSEDQKTETFAERRARIIREFREGGLKSAKEPKDNEGASLQDYVEALHEASTDPDFAEDRENIARDHKIDLDKL